MDINFSKLILPTTNKARLFNFITSIFDSDVLVDQFGIQYTRVGGINIYFNEVEHFDAYPKSFFCFSVKDAGQLEDLKSKIEFSFYRDDLGKPQYELTPDNLLFTDIDGNRWKIETEKLIPMQISHEIMQHDVRNY